MLLINVQRMVKNCYNNVEWSGEKSHLKTTGSMLNIFLSKIRKWFRDFSHCRIQYTRKRIPKEQSKMDTPEKHKVHMLYTYIVGKSKMYLYNRC